MASSPGNDAVAAAERSRADPSYQYDRLPPWPAAARPLHRPEPVAMGAPQPAKAPHRPPDHDAGSYWRSGNLPRMARAPLSPPPVRARYQHLGPADSGLAVRAHGGRHRSEGLERTPHRAQARGAETPPARGPARRSAAPDQPPFPLQHPQLHHRTGAQSA